MVAFPALRPFAESYRTGFLRAGKAVDGEKVLAGLGIGSVALWLGYIVIAKPPPLQGLLAFPISFALAALAVDRYVKFCTARRLAKFSDQLEVTLRLMSGGLSVGLGINQALVTVVDESPEPTRSEFLRVVGQSNVGISIYDALDQLAARMPSAEMTMFSRTIRIQSQTGGNLVKVIEHLAATIKARRRLQRKIRAISAEGRASGWVIGMLPVGVAVILVVTQPDMRKAIFSTFPGHMSLIAMAVLEGIGAFIIASMLKIDV